MPVSAADYARVAELLGRQPEGDFEVVVRDRSGDPVVIRNAPVLRDGRPMPTLYWLVGVEARRRVGRLEADGGVRTAEAAVSADALEAAHARYATERDDALGADHAGPKPTGGVGGTRRGVKCLHAHYAWHLAGGDDPVGHWTAEQLAAAYPNEAEAWVGPGDETRAEARAAARAETAVEAETGAGARENAAVAAEVGAGAETSAGAEV